MAEIGYTARVRLPYAIERGRTNLLRCPVERAGVVVAPASGTFTLIDATNTSLVDEEDVDVAADDIAEYEVPAFPDSPYGAGWLVRWKLTMPDGVVKTYTFGAALCVAGWFPTVGDGDLYALVSGLNPENPGCLTRLTTYQSFVDTAGEMLQRELLQGDKRPWLILDGSQLFEAHRLLAITLVFDDLATRNFATFGENAKKYRGLYVSAWGRVVLSYDKSMQGQVTGDGTGTGSNTQKPAATGSYWTNGRR